MGHRERTGEEQAHRILRKRPPLALISDPRLVPMSDHRLAFTSDPRPSRVRVTHLVSPTVKRPGGTIAPRDAARRCSSRATAPAQPTVRAWGWGLAREAGTPWRR